MDVPKVRFKLLRDVTAEDLAMDSADPGEGYPPEHVIGPAGSLVELYMGYDDDPEVTEVTGFANDPFATGYVPTSWLAHVPEED